MSEKPWIEKAGYWQGRAEVLEARVAALTQVAEAARRYRAFTPHYVIGKELDEALVALDGLVGLHEQEQK